MKAYYKDEVLFSNYENKWTFVAAVVCGVFGLFGVFLGSLAMFLFFAGLFALFFWASYSEARERQKKALARREYIIKNGRKASGCIVNAGGGIEKIMRERNSIDEISYYEAREKNYWAEVEYFDPYANKLIKWKVQNLYQKMTNEVGKKWKYMSQSCRMDVQDIMQNLIKDYELL